MESKSHQINTAFSVFLFSTNVIVVLLQRLFEMQCKFTHFNLYYRPQRSCGKVIFSQACVKNSVHRRGACVAGGTYGRRRHAWQGDVCGRGMCGRGLAWQEKRQLQRAVCILLECSLVSSENIYITLRIRIFK